MRRLLLLSLFLALTATAAESETKKPRLIVLTDIGGDADDEQSMVRLLLYSNLFDIEGLIATTMVHNDAPRGDGWLTVSHPELIRDRVEAYGKVRENLLKHAPGFPEKDALLRCVKAGSGDRTALSAGKGKDTEGSDWIVSVVDRDDPRPVWITIWGGPRELAQALWKVQSTRTDAEFAKWRSKLRVYSIGLGQALDQTGDGIRALFPDLFYVVAQGPTPQQAAFRGMYQQGDPATTTAEWLNANIRTDRGPLGALYPQNGAGVKGLKEGDTPSFLYLIPNGLGDPAHPEWGGWGGRFQLWNAATSKSWFADLRTFDEWNGLSNPDSQRKASVARWRPDFQNDFAARMSWCVKNAADANHPPHVILDGDDSLKILERTAHAGETLTFSAAGTKDPDNNTLRYDWFFYAEAGTYNACPDVKLVATESGCTVTPTLTGKGDLHLILRVWDNGTPALSAYRRTIIHVSIP